MGKRKLCTSMAIGAILGGLFALRHPEVRSYTKRKMSEAKSTSKFVIKNPSEAIQNMKTSLDQLHAQLSSGAENTINAIGEVEKSLEKLSNKS